MNPLFLIGTVGTAREDAEMLSKAGVKYKPFRLSEINLPCFPPQAKRPEFILYVRGN